MRVEKPLRIDFAGGWSDTPPICNELGGCVLNAAVLIDGKRPVSAEVIPLDKAEVHVESVDLKKQCILRKHSDIYAKKDPHDWCALVKSELAVVKYDFKLGGLSIRISADVPKGSGMGTSSILGAALIEALQKTFNRQCDPATVTELTLQLEQEMGTGGGWQDQVGALYPGVKLISTKSGKHQVLKVRRLQPTMEKLFAKYLHEYGVLYFTGQKRMARNVLKGVLSFYAKNPEGIAHDIVKKLKKDAITSFNALNEGDYQLFASCINMYWMSKKALDPGSTNPQVESIIARITPWTKAVTLVGAGGGGFLFAIARSHAAKSKICSVLDEIGNGGHCYDFTLDI